MALKQNILLSEEGKQILLGSILGDGCIFKKKIGNLCFYRYNETHSIKQKDYLLWKNNFLNFKYFEGISNPSNYKNFKYCVIHKGSKDLDKYYKLFYLYGKKKLNEELLKEINILGLCVYYLDDGHYNYNLKDIRLSIKDEEKIGLIKRWLKNKFGLETSIIKDGLRFNAKSRNNFINRIRNLVPESMIYKIGLDKVKEQKAKEDNKIRRKNYRKRPEVKQKRKLEGETWRKKNPNYGRFYYIKNKEEILKRIINNKRKIGSVVCLGCGKKLSRFQIKFCSSNCSNKNHRIKSEVEGELREIGEQLVELKCITERGARKIVSKYEGRN